MTVSGIPPVKDGIQGQRVGRNPPSVLGDIHLIGIPAPQAVFTGAYYPFHGVGWLFTLTASLLNASASSSAAGGGIFLRLYPTSRPAPHSATLPPRGWSFLRPPRGIRSRSPTRQPYTHINHHAINKHYGKFQQPGHDQRFNERLSHADMFSPWICGLLKYASKTHAQRSPFEDDLDRLQLRAAEELPLITHKRSDRSECHSVRCNASQRRRGRL